MTSVHTVADPGPQLGLGQQVVLELLAPLPHRLRRLQLVDQAADPGVEVDPQLVLRVVRHLAEHGARPVEQPLEDAVLDRLGQPPRGLVREARPQAGPVLGEEPVDGPQHHVEQLVVPAVLGHDLQGAAGERRQRGRLDAAPGRRPPAPGGPRRRAAGRRRSTAASAAWRASRAALSGSAIQVAIRGTTAGARTRSTRMSGVRKLCCTKSPSVSPNWSLRSTMIAVWGIGIAERMAEQRGDREPVGEAADHRRPRPSPRRSRPRWRRRPTAAGRPTRGPRPPAARWPGAGPAGAGRAVAVRWRWSGPGCGPGPPGGTPGERTSPWAWRRCTPPRATAVRWPRTRAVAVPGDLEAMTVFRGLPRQSGSGADPDCLRRSGSTPVASRSSGEGPDLTGIGGGPAPLPCLPWPPVRRPR